MQADSHIYHPSDISIIGHQLISKLSIEADLTAKNLEIIRGADVIELSFHPPYLSPNPNDARNGTACCALLVSICDNIGDKHIPATSSKKIAYTVCHTAEGNVCILQHIVGKNKRYEWDTESFASNFLQVLIQTLMES